MKNTLEKYCTKKAIKNTAVINPQEQVHPISICIPVHNEYPSFFSTLRSLHLSASMYLAKEQGIVIPVSIICCVNARNSDSLNIRENNAKMLYELIRISMSEFNDHPLLNIIVLDCTSDGSLFSNKEGVGLARKTAMDYAVLHGSDVLACLDADTLVSTSYIFCLESFYAKSIMSSSSSPYHSSWALTGFSHQRGGVEEEENAVRIYENYLLEHSRLLYSCGTPYYPVALGPTIVCTSQAYAECGGMNTRCAGEDFYFLQSLIKLHVHKDSIVYLSCRVFPSARTSDRVLFGTGRKICEIIEGHPCRVFENSSYKILRKFIDIFNKTKNENPMESFYHEVSNNLPELMPFLEKDGFFTDWQKIYLIHYKSSRNLEYAFHDRFDGLKIIRLFHFLENSRR